MKRPDCLRCGNEIERLRVFLCRSCARVLPAWVAVRRNRGLSTWRTEIEVYLRAERGAA